MKRLALLAALVIAVIFPVSAQAAVNEFTGLSCTQIWNAFQNPTPFVCLTESINFGGDKLILTGSSDIADLRFQQHTSGGLCSPKIIDDDNWNDCISAVWAQMGPADSLCLAGSAYYDNTQWYAASQNAYWLAYNANLGAANDKVSSVRLQQSGTSCQYL